MRFSFNWLKNHLDTDWSINKIADTLTAIGLEVESVSDPDIIFKNFQIVEILDVNKIEGTDKLSICEVVNANKEVSQVVCGAKNVRKGLKAILALPGAVIPSSKTVLKKAKIRGVSSHGMLCSYEELGVNDDTKFDGIIEVSDPFSLSSSVGDVCLYDGGIIDISLTPNRGDCFSVFGIARDLAAAGAGKLKIKKIVERNVDFPISQNIKFDSSDVSKHYMPLCALRTIKNIKNCESPKWLKIALRAAGINSISAIVDLANFVMLDIGRPLHVYDLNKIQGDVNFRFAKMQEKFTDLKGTEYRLKPDMMVAADDHNILCILGIMGSSKVACDKDTTDILIESAIFDEIFISRTGAYLNVTSDSRTRFERGIDTDSCANGIHIISDLIIETCGGSASEITLIDNDIIKKDKNIRLRKNKLISVTGSDIDWERAKDILHQLGIGEIFSNNEEGIFSIPSWRSDLKIEEDLIAEILRINVNVNINSERISPKDIDTVDVSLLDKKRVISIKKTLAAQGLNEIISYSFSKLEYADLFKENNKLIHLINPISADLGVMRPSLIPNLIASAVKSINYGKESVAIFEEGNVFMNSCAQLQMVSGIRVGSMSSRNWLEASRDVDVFDAKRDAYSVLELCGARFNEVVIDSQVPSYYHPTRSGCIMIHNKKRGYFGELHPKIGKMFNLNVPIVSFELFVDEILSIKKKSETYNRKVFPKICRDFAFLFNSSRSIGSIVNSIYKLSDIITAVDVFDHFDIGNGKKSIGITVNLESNTRTLTEEDAAEISSKIINFVDGIGGELRKK